MQSLESMFDCHNIVASLQCQDCELSEHLSEKKNEESIQLTLGIESIKSCE